jgi:cell division protein FtsA
MANTRVVVGLDIGTSKICTLIGEVKDTSLVEVVGVGVSPARGLKKGAVVDMDDAAASVAASLKKAEVFSGYKIVGAFVSVSGVQMHSELISRGMALPGDRPVSARDVEGLREAVHTDPPEGRRTLHVIPRGYKVDGENGVLNPVGMLASRLELEGLVVSAGASPLQNIARCVESSGIQIDGFVSGGLASGRGVLSEPENQLGVLLLDIGAGTTDYVWYLDGEPRLVGALPVGGNHISNDISVVLGVPFAMAEEIKVRHASAMPMGESADEVLDLGRSSEVRSASRRLLAEIVEARLLEIFDVVRSDLDSQEFDGVLPGGVVVTGGVAQMKGVRELAQQAFEAPARTGTPLGLSGLTDSIGSSAYAGGAGLLKWVLSHQEESGGSRPMRRRKGLWAKMRGFVRAFFP